ncbi:MAG: hypothetical protein ACOCZ5_01995 [bacterium]
MEYIQERFGQGVDEVNILKLGDTHSGHPNYIESLVDDALSTIVNRPNGRIFLMGDLCEMSLTNSVGSVYEQILSPEDQIDYWVDKLKPYKDIIIGGVSGNHEQRAINSVGMSPLRLIFKILDIQDKFYGYSAMVKYSFNKGCIHDYNVHGSTGARTKGGILNKMYKLKDIAEADIYSMGHTHQLITDDTEIRAIPDSRNMKINDRRYYYVNTGSALAWSESYAEMKNYPKTLLGFPIIRMTGERGYQNVELEKITL